MKRKNQIIIGSLIMIIAILIFGYASIIKDVSINRISVKGKERWNIKIKDVIKNKSLTSPEVIENEKPVINGNTISFDVSIPKPDLKITYDVTITNMGTLTAKLNSISSLKQINSSEPTNIIYSVEKLNAKANILPRLENDEFRITISSLPGTSDIYTKPATISFNYMQA